MFDTVVDPSAVTRAYTLPLEGATDAIKFYAATAARRAKLQQDANDTAREEQYKTQDAIRKFALQNIATGTVADPIISQNQNAYLPRIQELVKKGDTLGARRLADEGMAVTSQQSNWANALKSNINESIKSQLKANPNLDESLLLENAYKNSFFKKNPDGTMSNDLNYGQTTPNYGNVNFNDPTTLYPFTSKQKLEHGASAYLDTKFPKNTTVLTQDSEGNSFKDKSGITVDKSVKIPDYMTILPNGEVGIKSVQEGVEGGPLFPNLAGIEPSGGIGGGAIGNLVNQKEQLGKIPVIADEYLHTLASDDTGRGLLYHRVQDIQQNPDNFLGENGQKKLNKMSDAQLMKFAAYDILNTHTTKGGYNIGDVYTRYENSQKSQQQALNNEYRRRSEARAQATFDHAAKSNPDGFSGHNLYGKNLTNKEFKDTRDAVESVPGLWLKAVNSNSPDSQKEAIANLPPPVDFFGTQWFPLPTHANGKVDYLSDPLSHGKVSIFFDPVHDGGRFAAIPVVSGIPQPQNAKIYNGDRIPDFFNTYAPESLKGGSAKYEPLGTIVNQLFQRKP